MQKPNFTALLADCIEARKETALDLYAKAHTALAAACDALEALEAEGAHANVEDCREGARILLSMFESTVVSSVPEDDWNPAGVDFDALVTRDTERRHGIEA